MVKRDVKGEEGDQSQASELIGFFHKALFNVIVSHITQVLN